MKRFKHLLFLFSVVLLITMVGHAEEAGALCEWRILQFDIQANDGEPRYNAIIEVKNTSESERLYLGFARYDVYDSNGILIATDDSSVWGTPPVLIPGAVGYYHTNHYIDLPAGIDLSASYTLEPDLSVMRVVDGGVTEFEVQEMKFSSGEDEFPTLMGTLENSETVEMDVHVQLILLDAKGQIIDVVYTVECVPANGSVSFMLEDYKMFGRTDISDYKVCAQSFDLDYLD